MTNVAASTPALVELPREGFGDRLRRARRLAGYNQTEAGSLIGRSQSTVDRMERLEMTPDDSPTRVNACLLAFAYGFEPSSFDLTPEDLPVALRVATAQNWK